MITGAVNPQLEAVIPLVVRGLGSSSVALRFVIDTGFDGSLCLPPDQITALRLPALGTQLVGLGDGSEVELPVYEAAVEWNGRLVLLTALESDAGAMMGMAVLRGSRLTMDVEDDGPVRIEPIPRT